MRDIKFRAWCPSTNIMYVSGCLDLLLHFDGKLQALQESGLIVGTYNVPPMEVMQFTGLTDKNGKEIYEGDVVRTSITFEVSTLPHMGEVVYCEEYGSFGTRNDAGITLFVHHCVNTREVIGNIYETPELLSTP